jgi:hypothetical protein
MDGWLLAGILNSLREKGNSFKKSENLERMPNSWKEILKV